MMRSRPAYVLDANVLARTLQPETHPDEFQAATSAISGLISRGHDLNVTPQILVEFCSVLTRNSPRGLGLTNLEAEQELAKVELFCNLLYD